LEPGLFRPRQKRPQKSCSLQKGQRENFQPVKRHILLQKTVKTAQPDFVFLAFSTDFGGFCIKLAIHGVCELVALPLNLEKS
jgi:hypothetical protein